jgi:hypothetical protein
MRLFGWIQTGILIGSLLFHWICGSGQKTEAPASSSAPCVEISLRIQGDEGETTWRGFVSLEADSSEVAGGSPAAENRHGELLRADLSGARARAKTLLGIGRTILTLAGLWAGD